MRGGLTNKHRLLIALLGNDTGRMEDLCCTIVDRSVSLYFAALVGVGPDHVWWLHQQASFANAVDGRVPNPY